MVAFSVRSVARKICLSLLLPFSFVQQLLPLIVMYFLPKLIFRINTQLTF